MPTILSAIIYELAVDEAPAPIAKNVQKLFNDDYLVLKNSGHRSV